MEQLSRRCAQTAQVLGVMVVFAGHSPTDYMGAFALITREHPDALIVISNGGSNIAI
jgi:hypothetical protein